MSSSNIVKAIILEGGAVVCLARVRDETGAVITPSDVSAITCKVFDLNTQAQISTPSVTSASFYSSLQTDARWREDSTGYNFAAKLAGSNFPAGNTTYQVIFRVTPASGNGYALAYELTTENLLDQ